MDKLVDFLKKHQLVFLIIVATLAFMYGRSSGSWSEEREFTQDVLYRTDTKTSVLIVHTKSTVVKDHWYERTVIESPDGTKVTTEKGGSHEKSETETNTTDVKKDERTELAESTKYRVKTESKPNWRFGLDVGLDVPSIVTGSPQVVFGGQVDYRIGGPFFVGARANTQGVIGVGLSMEF